ncbi:hypothetical protein ACHHYP_06872 [Achlya hypogyna]|uniref:Uncharacterized protein n=1 Tax=Achlya hypogyna TaxID=1202772 RepID=A0A1V9YRF0_ACHHY|nr:hypothetical protein ACHHYP_06872 [Achlya hypogyna]
MRATRAAIVATAQKPTESVPFQRLVECYTSYKGGTNNALELEEKLMRTPDASLNDTIQALCDTEDPAVRLKLSKLALSLVALSEKTELIVECVHTIVTDVWSQIRKDGARNFAKNVVTTLPTVVLEAILNDMIRLVKADTTEWKALDGGFYLLAVVLATVQKTASGYLLGTATIEHLPPCILSDLKPAVYLAMKNEQVSVREHATAALTNYIAISDSFTQVFDADQCIYLEHTRGIRLAHSKRSLASSICIRPTSCFQLPTPKVRKLPAKSFLRCVKGLLDVAAQLVPHIPIAFLAKHWHVVFPTCEKYVMHLASTVRQKASHLIAALAELSVTAPSETSLLLLHSILSSLATPCSLHSDVSQRDYFWQRMEGRLMSLEGVLSLLGRDHAAAVVSGIDSVRPKPFMTVPDVGEPAAAVWMTVSNDLGHYTYAHDMAPLATWVPNEPSSAPSVLQRVIDAKAVDMRQLWQAWIQQIYESFLSPQFELKRMAIQTLPGLVRLAPWLGASQLLLEWVQRQAAKPDFRFVCLGFRAMLLHARFLYEVPLSIRCRLRLCQVLGAATSPTLVDVVRETQDAIDALTPVVERLGAGGLTEKADVLSFAEVAILGAIQARHSSTTSTAKLIGSLAAHCSLSPPNTTKDASLDRAMSSTVVRFLPSLVQVLPLTTLADQADAIATFTCAWLQPQDADLRWIVVDIAEAFALLLDTLLLLAVGQTAV